MRRTTISPATFSSARWRRAAGLSLSTHLALLSAGGLFVACGKRGDPLPPLRPVPATAEAVRLRQLGDRLVLDWRAPLRNEDGTTENVNLTQARILRRVLDLDALVEAQTLPAAPAPEPATSQSEEAPSENAETATPPPPEPPEPAAVSGAPGEADETPAGSVSLEESDQETGEPEPPAEPAVPARPLLVIPPFPIDAVEVTLVPSQVLDEKLAYGEPVDPEWIGKRVEYAIVYENRKKRSSPISTVVRIEPVPALPPPLDVGASGGEGFVSVHWTAPVAPSPLNFAVYRRLESSADYSGEPLADALPETSVEDRETTYGVPVCYVVTSLLPPPVPPAPPEEETPAAAAEEEVDEVVDSPPPADAPPGPVIDVPPDPQDVEEVAEEGTKEGTEEIEEGAPIVPLVPPITEPVRVESVPSEEVCLTPEDHFAPPPPTAVAAVPAPGGVLLTWREAEAADLAGYRVYRSASREGPFQLLREVRGTSHTDLEVSAGETYFYVVTAIDDAPGTNESVRSEVVSARPQ